MYQDQGPIVTNQYCKDVVKIMGWQMEAIRKFASKADIEENFQETYDRLELCKTKDEYCRVFKDFLKCIEDCGLTNPVAEHVRHRLSNNVDLSKESI